MTDHPKSEWVVKTFNDATHPVGIRTIMLPQSAFDQLRREASVKGCLEGIEAQTKIMNERILEAKKELLDDFMSRIKEKRHYHFAFDMTRKNEFEPTEVHFKDIEEIAKTLGEKKE